MACMARWFHPPLDESRRRCLTWAAAALAIPPAGCAMSAGGAGPAPGDYAAAMRRALQSVTGELPGYQFRATPVGNFGVGSVYAEDLAGTDPRQAESHWFLGGPDNWLLPTLGPAERRQWLDRLVSEGSMGPFSLSSSGWREVHAQAGTALLSALMGGVTGSVSLDTRQGVESRLEAADVRQRRLNWAEFDAALRAGQVVAGVAERVRSGRFIVAAADVALVGYRAEIAVDESRNPAVSAVLRSKALFAPRISGSAGLRVAEGANGRFVVSLPQPAVAAVLFKRPPPLSKDFKGSSPPGQVDSWPTAAIDARALAAVEAAVTRLPGVPAQ